MTVEPETPIPSPTPAAMPPAGTLPPLEPLLEVRDRLTAAGLEFALGGSGLLQALGLVERVGDWDLQTDADPEAVARVFAGVEHERFGASGVHADSKLRLHGGAVELIVRMAFRSPSGICRIPVLPSGTWNTIPLGSPEAWAAAYFLLGRRPKADLLLDYLARVGADANAIQRMLREPLPPELSRQLAGLPRHTPAA